jgi:hypothetical protein
MHTGTTKHMYTFTATYTNMHTCTTKRVYKITAIYTNVGTYAYTHA